MTPTLPAEISVIQGGSWSVIDFISDLHLQQSDAANFQTFAHYLTEHSPDALFILGDLFEVWVGDDLIYSTHGVFEKQCLGALKTASARFPIYFLAGNRDFLLGQRALYAGGMQDLSEPSVLKTKTSSILLSHGDNLCLDDLDYKQFRLQVRSQQWQAEFLAKPLQERIQEARAIRAQSEARKTTNHIWVDVDATAAVGWLTDHKASLLLHGHTHRAAVHQLGNGLERQVLSDWHADSDPPRLQGFSWQAGRGFERTDLSAPA